MRRHTNGRAGPTFPSSKEHLPIFPVDELRANWRGGNTMPVIILWAVPAIIAVGGGIYLISHMH
jgi:hypothetical protein